MYETNVRLSRMLVSATFAFSLLALWALCFAPLSVKFVASSLALLSCSMLLVSDRKLITEYRREINTLPWIVCFAVWFLATIFLWIRLIG